MSNVDPIPDPVALPADELAKNLDEPTPFDFETEVNPDNDPFVAGILSAIDRHYPSALSSEAEDEPAEGASPVAKGGSADAPLSPAAELPAPDPSTIAAAQEPPSASADLHPPTVDDDGYVTIGGRQIPTAAVAQALQIQAYLAQYPPEVLERIDQMLQGGAPPAPPAYPAAPTPEPDQYVDPDITAAVTPLQHELADTRAQLARVQAQQQYAAQQQLAVQRDAYARELEVVKADYAATTGFDDATINRLESVAARMQLLPDAIARHPNDVRGAFRDVLENAAWNDPQTRDLLVQRASAAQVAAQVTQQVNTANQAASRKAKASSLTAAGSGSAPRILAPQKDPREMTQQEFEAGIAELIRSGGAS